MLTFSNDEEVIRYLATKAGLTPVNIMKPKMISCDGFDKHGDADKDIDFYLDDDHNLIKIVLD